MVLIFNLLVFCSSKHSSCHQKITTINSTDTMLYQYQQSRYNRTGLLCGSYRKGFSLIFGTSECREKCSNWWLLLVIPFALAGIFHYLLESHSHNRNSLWLDLLCKCDPGLLSSPITGTSSTSSLSSSSNLHSMVEPRFRNTHLFL